MGIVRKNDRTRGASPRILYGDCLEMLRKSSVSDLFTDSWNDLFFRMLQREATNNRLKRTLDSLPIKTNYELKALLLLVRQMTRDMSACFDFCSAEYNDCCSYSAICPDGNISMADTVYLKDAMETLIKENLAVPVSKPKEDSESEQELEGYMLSVRTTKELLKGRDEYVKYERISQRAIVIRHSAIRKKELFFPKKTEDGIKNLIKILMPECYNRTCDILKKNGMNELVSGLLWGPPGTGKTESAKQIALQTGRELILVDVSKLNGSAWGASEKNYRSLFRDYSYIAAISSYPPILFLNEADQILSKRVINIESSIDKAENTVTNIVLQEIEDMEGVVLATTNLLQNLDSAFDRRFIIKIELPNPDEFARYRIWKHLLKDEISTDECHKLADEYELSGAQINNIVTKRAMAELYYDGDRSYKYITQLCLEEITPSFGTRMHTKIGF